MLTAITHLERARVILARSGPLSAAQYFEARELTRAILNLLDRRDAVSRYEQCGNTEVDVAEG
jgi:hypothetical protein